MWYVLHLPYPSNKEKIWDILLHKYIFILEYMKLHAQSLQEVSEADQVVVQNLVWSGVYLRITLSKTLLHKVISLVTLTATGPQLFIVSITTFLSDLYDYLEETLTHMKSIKIKICSGENDTDFCAAVLVDAERLESTGAFMFEHLGYITCIFGDTSDSRFRLLGIQKYKKVKEFINKLRV